jgi:CCR4-NOT transcriptional complex subunit CAF120
MEGWVRIRIAGQTDWKRMWMVVSASTDGTQRPDSPPSGTGTVGGLRSPNTLTKKKRMSTLFSRDSAPTASSKPQILMFASQKPKDKKKPLLTLSHVTQAFAVYPERPELISRSTLIKMEGLFGVEETAGAMKSREGWLLLMPEPEGGLSESAEMLKWVVGESEVSRVFESFLMSMP